MVPGRDGEDTLNRRECQLRHCVPRRVGHLDGLDFEVPNNHGVALVGGWRVVIGAWLVTTRWLVARRCGCGCAGA
jgi:hypothetical protein